MKMNPLTATTWNSARGLVLAVIIAMVGGCDHKQPKGNDERRQFIQGFQTTFYRVTDGKQGWTEISIAVDRSETFRMPVFFTNDGAFVQISNDEAVKLIDRWIKQRAANIAAYGSIDPQVGPMPFLAIDLKQP